LLVTHIKFSAFPDLRIYLLNSCQKSPTNKKAGQILRPSTEMKPEI
jgi:hypothetical protein